jgi:hypothetical protein
MTLRNLTILPIILVVAFIILNILVKNKKAEA